MTNYRRTRVHGQEVFYREAGPADKPTVVLLHGFPSSSHMFRELIPRLAEHFHVVAPDMIGFGYSAQPTPGEFQYTFDNLAAITEELLFVELKLKSFSLYVQDYGAPVGYRIASRHADAIEAIIVQNGNAYSEGLSPAWEPLRALWSKRSRETEDAVRNFLSAESTKFQYTHGAKDLTRISPDSYTVDQFFLDRAGNDRVQLDLFYDYASNLALYPEWQAYFRKSQPPMLLVWGINDPFLTVEGAKAFLRDLPTAELHLLEAGHFALEEEGEAIAGHIVKFIGGIPAKSRTKSV